MKTDANARWLVSPDVDEYLSKLENMGLVERNGLFHESKAAGARG